MTDSIETGRQALTYFYNASKKYSVFNYSFDRMLEIISGSPKAVQFFLDGMGTAIIEIQKDDFLTGSKVENAMTKLADISKGNIPDKKYFFSALSQEAQNVTFINAIPSVISGTASELVKGAQEIGNTLIDTGKIINLIFPFAIVGGLIYFFTKKVKKVSE